MADALAVQQHDLVPGPGDGDLVQPGHVVELALRLAAAAAEEALAGDLLSVRHKACRRYLCHRDFKRLDPRFCAERFALFL